MKDDTSPKRPAPRLTGARLVCLVLGLLLLAGGALPEALSIGSPGLGMAQRALIAMGVLLSALVFAPARWSRIALTAGGASVVTLGLAELLLRLFLSAPFATLFELDASRFYRLIPDARKVTRRSAANGGQLVETHVNGQGFRGADLRPAGGGKRIVVYGDSCVQGSYSDLDATFVAQIARQLNGDRGGGDADRFEVVNAGVNGYGPDQVCLRLEQEVGTLRPDVVIVCLFADNDFGDPVRNKLFGFDAGGTLVRRRGELHPALAAEFQGARWDPLVWKILRKAAEAMGAGGGPSLARWIERREDLERDRGARLAEYRDAVIDANDTVTNLFGDGYDADVSLEPDGEASRYKIRLLGAVLRRMAQHLAGERIPWAVVVVPSRLDIQDGRATGLVDAAAYPGYDPAFLSDRMQALAEEQGAPCLNLRNHFLAHGAAALYWKMEDNHWNDEGQRIAAERLAAFLRERGLVR